VNRDCSPGNCRNGPGAVALLLIDIHIPLLQRKRVDPHDLSFGGHSSVSPTKCLWNLLVKKEKQCAKRGDYYGDRSPN
jgi:hypothetical protein